MPNYTPRWIPVVNELVGSRLSTHWHDFSPKVRTVLQGFQTKFKNPLRSPFNPNKSRLFVNNYLNLAEVDVIGFDLDYTLVPYTVELQNLIFTMARDILVSAFGYPKDLKTRFFDPNFAIRGLSVDSRNGVLIKLNHLQRIGLRCSFKGKKRLTAVEMEEYYGPTRHIPHADLNAMRPLNDMFSMAEACLIADAIELYEHRKTTKGELYSPTAIVDDVQAAIREVHVSGAMHNAVIADVERFVNYNPRLISLLEHFANAGKKMFLCTNSGFRYTDHALKYALGLPLKRETGTLTDWKQLFDVVICSARKPDFYFSNKPFRHWNIDTDRPSPTPVDDLVKGQVYVHGSVQSLHRAKKWLGKSVLYIGDNLRADLVDARRFHGWHTGGIINELDREIEIQGSHIFNELHYVRSSIRQLLNDVQLAMASPDNAEQATNRFSSNPSNEEFICALEQELQKVNSELSSLFNPQFGSMFRTDGHTSYFAFSVRRYADVYMSDVCHMLNYSPEHRFYPAHALHMAHDPVYTNV